MSQGVCWFGQATGLWKCTPPSPPDNENTPTLAAPPTATLNGFFLDTYPEAARALWKCRKGAAKLLDMSVQFLGFPASVAGEYEPIFAYAGEGLEPRMQGHTPRTTDRLASEKATSPLQVDSNAGPAIYWTQARAVIRDVTTSSTLQLEAKWAEADLDSVQPPAEAPPPDSPPGPPGSKDDGASDDTRTSLGCWI